MNSPAFQHPEIESLDRADILAIQRRKLEALGRRLSQSPSWVAHFRTGGMHPADLRDHESLASVPMLEKAHLRSLYPFPLLTVDLDRVRRFTATSGTTGLPVMFGLSERDLGHLIPYQICRILKATGVRPGERFYQGYGYGLWIGGISMDVGLNAYGTVNFPLGPGRGELAAEWLRDHEYTACSMSPLWLMTLANTAEKMGIDPKRDWKLRVGLFGGQSISKPFRDRLEEAMPEGFVAHNIYGTTEAGGPILGISCQHSHDTDEMHLINDDTVMAEIVDPETLVPVKPGEIGELIVTTLDREASPVVRWRTRDLVRLSEHPYDCPCGRKGLPLIGRIIGRTDDMLKVRGVMVYPTQIEDIIAATAGTVKEAWQIYIDNKDSMLDQLSVEIERAGTSTASAVELANDVQLAIQARLGIRADVRCMEQGALPRYEGKAVRVHVKKSND